MTAKVHTFAGMNELDPGTVLAKLKIKHGIPPRYSAKTIRTAAQDLGQLGGIKGGPARAASLPQKEINLIARYGALIRWKLIDISYEEYKAQFPH